MSYFRYTLLMILAFAGLPRFADADTCNSAAPERSNLNLGRESPPNPCGMKLLQPGFSLPGWKPTNSMPTAQLQLTSAVMTNSDIADTTVGSSVAASTVFYNGGTLRMMPKLTEDTRISANINGGFIRYDGDETNDYDMLNANLGLFRQLGERMAAELGWRYAQFYLNEKISSNQNVQEQGARFALNRTDPLPYRLFLLSNYEIQANFSDPVDRSRISQFATAGLGYNLTNRLQATVFYRLRHDDYTERTVNDISTRHEFQGQLSYQANKYLNLAGTVSYLFGDTVDLLRDPLLASGVNPESSNELNNLSFGLRINVSAPLLE